MIATKYRKLPVEVEAVRYGKDDDGRWYDGAVTRVAAFMLGLDIDAQLHDGQILEVLEPCERWNPPEICDLQLWDGVAHQQWLPLALGDYVVKGTAGEFYPCKPEIFAATFEPASVYEERALDRIEAANPGIDREEVRALRAGRSSLDYRGCRG